MNHLMLFALALSALLALSACGADGDPIAPLAEPAPIVGQTTTTTAAGVGVTVDSDGVQPSAGVGFSHTVQTSPNVTLFAVGSMGLGFNR